MGTTLSDPSVRVGPSRPTTSARVGIGMGFDDCDEEENEKSVVVKMWSNGFSLDDGPLRSYTDPDSADFIASIKAGRIPAVSIL